MGRNSTYAAVLVVLIGTGCLDAPSPLGPAGTSPAPTVAAPSGERFIVVLRAGTLDVHREALRLATTHGGEIDHVYQHAIPGFAARFPAEAVADVQRDPDVAFVEADVPIRPTTTQPFATWGIDRIDQRKLPLSGTYTYHYDGSGVRVYVLDNGVRATHQEFGGRVTLGFTAFPEEIGIVNCGWHGTHVAGTIGSTTYGVAKQVSLVDVRVLPCASEGYASTVIAGVDWVTANHIKPAVANMSVGAPVIHDALNQAVAASIAAGVTYVVAAGNDNADACFSSPARVPAALTVGSTTSSDNKAATSNFGECLDLFAPGDIITSVSNWSDTDTKAMSGTSAAAPHVAGVAALVLQGQPAASPSTVGRTIIQNATTGRIKRPGSGSPGRLLYAGFLGSVVREP